MDELSQVYLNTPSYGFASYTSDWFEVSSIASFIFSAYSAGSTFTMSINYAVDKNYDILYTSTQSSSLGVLCVLTSDVVLKYAQFKITSFTPGQDLKLQAFISTIRI